MSPRDWWHATAMTAEPKGELIRGIVSSIYTDWSGYPGPSQVNWYPKPWMHGGLIDGNPAVSLVGNGEYIAAGGDFLRIGTVWQQGLARFGNPNVVDPQRGPGRRG